MRRRSFLLMPFGLAALHPALAQAQAGLPLYGRGADGGEVTVVSGWRLVYFGYTHCPDVCPMGLFTMSETLKALGPLGERITPVFVTVDPERDTPEAMKEYVGFFHPRFVALSPSAGQLAEMAAAWRIRFQKVERQDGGAYTVDHTSSVFLADPAGVIVGRFPHSLDAEAMANKIRAVFLRG